MEQPPPVPIAITIAVAVTNGLSLCALAGVLALYATLRSLRRHPASLVVARCLADLLFGVVTLASHLQRGAACEVWSFASQVLAVAAELYTLLQAVDMVLSVSNPFTNWRANLKTYHVLVWLCSAATATLLLVVRDGGPARELYGRDFMGACWIRRLDAREGGDGVGGAMGSLAAGRYLWYFFIGPVTAIYAASGVLLLLAAWRLSQGLPQSLAMRVAKFRDTYRFILSFSLYWVLALVVYMVLFYLEGRQVSAAHREADTARLELVLATFLGSRGFVTAVVWCYTYGQETLPCQGGACSSSSSSSLCGASGGTRRRSGSRAARPLPPSAAADDLDDGRPHLNLSLRAEILYYTRLGIARSVLRAKKRAAAEWRRARGGGGGSGGGSGAEVFYNRLLLPRIHEERGLFKLQREKEGRASLAEASSSSRSSSADAAGAGVGAGAGGSGGGHLSLPLLQPAGSGGAEEPEEEAYAAAAAAEESEDAFLQRMAGRPSMMEEEGEAGGEDWEGAEEGAEESPYAALDSPAAPGPAPKPYSSSAQDAEPYLPNSFAGMLTAVFSSARHFVFHDFEPHTFQRLRELDGITVSEYLRALSASQKERFSEGHSGAFLYFSSCNRFIVKTIVADEAEALLAMLKDYEAHLRASPNSLLTRFYGCHAMTMYGTTLYFAVMKNVLISHGALIHERYDLKGSWVNRLHVPVSSGQRTECRHCSSSYIVGSRADLIQCPMRPNHVHEPNTILCDNDWDYKLRLGRRQARTLIHAIRGDTEFLQSQGIMDYSLLLGIHRSKYRLVGAGREEEGGEGGGSGEEGEEEGRAAGGGAGALPGRSAASAASGSGSASASGSAAAHSPFSPAVASALVSPLAATSSIPIPGAAAAPAVTPLRLSPQSGSFVPPSGPLSPGVLEAGTLPGTPPFFLSPTSSLGDRGSSNEDASPRLGPDAGGSALASGRPASSALAGGRWSEGSSSSSSSGGGALAGILERQQQQQQQQQRPQRRTEARDGERSYVIEQVPSLPAEGEVEVAGEGAGGGRAGTVLRSFGAAASSSSSSSSSGSGGSSSGSGEGASSQHHVVFQPQPPQPLPLQLVPKSNLFSEYKGGIRATVVEGPGIYYLGIIDVLQRWTLAKRLENWFKSHVLCQDTSGLSAVDPVAYAKRFSERVLAQLVEGSLLHIKWDEQERRAAAGQGRRHAIN